MKGTLRAYQYLLAATAILAVSAGLTDCATNPATGKRQLNLVSTEQEIQLGKESDAQIVQSMGIYEDEEVGSYVEDIGKRLAASSERPDLPWTFRVIDDPTVNAFALPGGFIYVTRGILTHLKTEDELAGVLGHEVGHVTAQHGPNQLSKQQLTQFGLGVAMVLSPGLQQFAPLASLGMQLMFLKFSREDELQADELGVRYMARINEDPRDLISVMAMLGNVSDATGGGRLPEWLSTHPYPENREEVIERAIAELDPGETGTLGSGDTGIFLRLLDGMKYGPDPREGFSRDGIFYHPELRFQMDFPEGWRIINQKEAVLALEPGQAAAMQLSLSRAATVDEAMRDLYEQAGVEGDGGQSMSVNGHPAAATDFVARTEQGVLAGSITFVDYGGRIYQLIGYSAEQTWQGFVGPVRESVSSFRELDDPAFLNVEAPVLRIVEVPSVMTLREFSEAYPSPAVSIEELALLNRVEPDATIESGTLMKQVVGERFDTEE